MNTGNKDEPDKNNLMDLLSGDNDIIPYLELKDKANISATSKNFHRFFDGELTKASAQEILTQIINRNFDTVKKMLESNPRLLTIRETVIDHSGRTITATPFQAALGAEDEDMWQLIETFFYRLPNGFALKQQQFRQQFPEGIMSESYNFSELGRVFSKNKQLEQIILEFREFFKPGNLEHGRHFDMLNIINAYKALNAKQESWSWKERSLFWINIIGYLKRLTPISYANVYYQDPLKPIPDSVNPTLCLRTESPLYPLEENKGLGFDWGISLESKGGKSSYEAISYRNWEPIEKLYENKTALLQTLEEKLFPKELKDKNKNNCIIS